MVLTPSIDRGFRRIAQNFGAAETFLEGLRGCFKGDREEVSLLMICTIAESTRSRIGTARTTRRWKHLFPLDCDRPVDSPPLRRWALGFGERAITIHH